MAHVSPSSRGVGGIIAPTLVLLLLAMGFVVLRLWARRMKGKLLAFNDYAIMGALFFSTSLHAMDWVGVFWAGTGHHIDDLPPDVQDRTAMLYVVLNPLWGLANCFVKLSILHLYVTIFPGRRTRWACYIMMVVAVLYFIAVLLIGVLLCRPVAYNWDKTIAGGWCSPNETAAALATGIAHPVTDIIIVLLPIPALWQMTIPVRKRVALIFMFSLGIFNCVVSFLRLVAIAQIDFDDVPYTAVTYAMWSTVEPTLGIVTASIPTLRLAFAYQWLQSVVSRGQSSSPRTPSEGEEHPAPATIGDSDNRQRKSPKVSDDAVDQLYPISGRGLQSAGSQTVLTAAAHDDLGSPATHQQPENAGKVWKPATLNERRELQRERRNEN